MNACNSSAQPYLLTPALDIVQLLVDNGIYSTYNIKYILLKLTIFSFVILISVMLDVIAKLLSAGSLQTQLYVELQWTLCALKHYDTQTPSC